MGSPQLRTRMRRIVILISVATLIGSLHVQSEAAQNQDDAALLQRAQDSFKADNLEEAERICEGLAKGNGPVASDCQDLLNKIKSRRGCERDAEERLLPSIQSGNCAGVSQALASIQQMCPDYYSRLSLVHDAREKCPAPSEPPLDQGIDLFNEGDYGRALAYFEDLRTIYSNHAEVDDWIHKTKVEQLFQEVKSSLRAKEWDRAKERINDLKKLAPADNRIPTLLAALQSQSSAQSKPGKQAESGTGVQGALLDSAIRQFYGGNLQQADQLLQEYLSSSAPAKLKALAYFYQGAIQASTYFLAGAKDEVTETLARQSFLKARQAEPEFQPPRDWISPKIMELYDKAAGGS
jgi:hypothetical protein